MTASIDFYYYYYFCSYFGGSLSFVINYIISNSKFRGGKLQKISINFTNFIKLKYDNNICSLFYSFIA